ncbi:hypothetical protein SH139x_002242 [Planctomycetaceae bacterium SH139]
MKPHDPYRPELPPPPFVPPFDPPGSQTPYIPEGSSTDDDSDESTIASSSDDLGPRPDWWPEDWPWPPEPEEPVVLEAYPPIHVWPRLPPDHPYHVPPGYEAPHHLPPGHPGEYYPNMPPYPVVHPVQPDEESSNDGGST